jgi:hypothetical protein
MRLPLRQILFTSALHCWGQLERNAFGIREGGVRMPSKITPTLPVSLLFLDVRLLARDQQFVGKVFCSGSGAGPVVLFFVPN